jgi:hypothetical protein
MWTNKSKYVTYYDIIGRFYRTYLKIQLNIRRKLDRKLRKPAAGPEYKYVETASL